MVSESVCFTVLGYRVGFNVVWGELLLDDK